MARKSGTDLRVYMGGNPIGYATECTLNIDMATVEVLHKDSAGNSAEVDASTISWTMSCSGFVSEDTTINTVTVEDQTALQDAILARTSLTLKWSTGATGERLLTGSAYITNYSETGSVGETATYTVNFTGDGALTAGTEA